MAEDRFADWKPPEIEDGKPTKYNWVVQNKNGLMNRTLDMTTPDDYIDTDTGGGL
jgi:hypothetical protein